MDTIKALHLGSGIFRLDDGKCRCFILRGYIYDIPLGETFLLVKDNIILEWVSLPASTAIASCGSSVNSGYN